MSGANSWFIVRRDRSARCGTLCILFLSVTLTFVGCGGGSGSSTQVVPVPSGNQDFLITSGSTSVSSFKIDEKTGQLQAVSDISIEKVTNNTQTVGVQPLLAHPSGRFIYLPLFTTTSPTTATISITGYAVDLNGLISPTPVGNFLIGNAAAGDIAMDPSGRFVFLFGIGELTCLRIGADGSLTQFGKTSVPGTPTFRTVNGGTVVVDASGRFVYVATSSVGPPPIAIYGYSFDSSAGTFSLIPGSPVMTGVESNLTIAGNFLYAIPLTNIQGTPVHLYSIDSNSGSLAESPVSPLSTPIGVVDPSGHYSFLLTIDSQQTQQLSTYKINASTGELNGPLSTVPISDPYTQSFSAPSVAFTRTENLVYVLNFHPAPVPAFPVNVGVASFDPASGSVSQLPISPIVQDKFGRLGVVIVYPH